MPQFEHPKGAFWHFRSTLCWVNFGDSILEALWVLRLEVSIFFRAVSGSFFPERALAQGSLCLELCFLLWDDSIAAGGLKCRKNAVKMKRTSKHAGKVAFEHIWEGLGK